MKLNILGNLKFYTFESFEKTNLVNHCFSTRHGGVSSGFCKSMNLSFKNDKKENVIQNFKIICNAIGCDYKNVVFSNQVHKDKIHIVTNKDRGKGLLKESDIKEIDALITNENDIVLTTFYADCVPVYFLDPNKKVVAIAHSGWKGTLQNIAVKTILKMKKIFYTNVEDILVGIGPSICKSCFQVDEDLVNKFCYKFDFAKKYIIKDEKLNKYKIDLQSIIKKNLILIGVNKQNIELSNICTMCNKKDFFSHRVMGIERGSLAGLISLK